MAENNLFISTSPKTFRHSKKLNTLEKAEAVWDNLSEAKSGKPTKFSWGSLAKAFGEMYIMADPTGLMSTVGVVQAQRQKKEGIKSTAENNWYLRRFKRLEDLKEKNVEANEKDYIDIVEDYEKGIYKGLQSVEWNIGDILTAGIDLGPGRFLETQLNEDLTNYMTENRIADPETLVGDALEILVEYGLPGSAVFKIAGRLKKIESIRKKAAAAGALTTMSI